jgi:hypothetical protein
VGEKSAADELAKLSDKYSSGGKGDFDSRFKVVGINYSSLFKEILVEWGYSSCKLLE